MLSHCWSHHPAFGTSLSRRAIPVGQSSPLCKLLLPQPQSLGSTDGQGEVWVEGTSAKPSNWGSRLANFIKYGNPNGYFVGRKHWREVFEEEDRRLTLHQEQSSFGAVHVFQCGEFRFLMGDVALHSVAFTGGSSAVDSSHLVMGYVMVMLCAAVGFSGVACLGIGGGSLPAFLCERVPVVAVDIDPAVVSAALCWMGLPSSHPGLEVVIQDAAHVVRQRTESIAEARALPWNAIFLDVYDSNCAVPPHLATLGFIGDCRRCLAEGGCLVVNLLNGEAGSSARRALAAFILTVIQVFQDVFTLRVPDMPENVVLVAVNFCPVPAAPPPPDAFPSSVPSSTYSFGRTARASDDARPSTAQSGSVCAPVHISHGSRAGQAGSSGLSRIRLRAVQAKAREVGRDLQVPYDMGDLISDVFRVVRDESLKDGFVEIRL